MNNKKVTFNVDEDVYCEHKKALIDLRTNPTADFKRHMQDVIDKVNNAKSKEERQ